MLGGATAEYHSVGVAHSQAPSGRGVCFFFFSLSVGFWWFFGLAVKEKLIEEDQLRSFSSGDRIDVLGQARGCCVLMSCMEHGTPDACTSTCSIPRAPVGLGINSGVAETPQPLVAALGCCR